MRSHIMPVYNPAPVSPVRGQGAWLYEADGTAWLDCVGGIATNALGHCHPVLVRALSEQANALWHVSNALQIEQQAHLAKRLTDHSFADRVFFCSTGSEAVECALKVARRFHARHGSPDRVNVIGFHGSFHGRTYAAINASGNAAYLSGFGPALPGYVHVSLDDGAGLAAAIADAATAAVIIEPVQGEGGARALDEASLREIHRLCKAHGVLLIYDEVQSGMGRTGQLFAHQWFEGLEPDIMAVAKALGAGFPVAACLASEHAASGMDVGAHGSTFGGNPLGMAVAMAAFDEIAREEMLANARAMSEVLRSGLEDLHRDHPGVITQIRGKGLLIGVKLVPNNRAFMAAARDQRLLVAGCGDNCIRLLPPLNITLDIAEAILARFAATCRAMDADGNNQAGSR